MQWLKGCVYLGVAICFAGACCAVQVSAAGQREIAVTMDDLPAARFSSTSGDSAVFRQQKIPAVGFVNEEKLYKWGEVDQRIKCLQMWLDSGFELGNHTFSHPSLHKVGLKNFEDDVIQGEPVLRLLLAQHNMKLRYFRHPYLESGKDIQTKRDLEAFLSQRGYTIAPVTVDPFDWMFAAVYDDANQRGDTAMAQRVAQAFLSHVDAVFAYSEQASKEVVGYEVKQTLLLHGNNLEADYLPDVVQKIRARGYRFITLEDALSDPAYAMPDLYEWLLLQKRR